MNGLGGAATAMGLVWGVFAVESHSKLWVKEDNQNEVAPSPRSLGAERPSTHV